MTQGTIYENGFTDHFSKLNDIFTINQIVVERVCDYEGLRVLISLLLDWFWK